MWRKVRKNLFLGDNGTRKGIEASAEMLDAKEKLKEMEKIHE